MMFDQQEFALANSGMNDYGYIFIPTQCLAKQCNLHIVLSGASQYPSKIGSDFVEHTGYLEYASANDMVMMFP